MKCGTGAATQPEANEVKKPGSPLLAAFARGGHSSAFKMYGVVLRNMFLRRGQQQRRTLCDHERVLIMRRRPVIGGDDGPAIGRDERPA